MGQDPPGVLQGAFWSGMPGMAQGSQRHEPRHLTSALQLSLALTLSRLETHMGLEQGHPAVSELTAISNGARRHRVVCWLPTKWTNFDVQLCRSWGQAAPRAYRDEEAGVASPIGVGNLPLVCLHHGENARKWSSETVPDVDLNGKQVLMERRLLFASFDDESAKQENDTHERALALTSLQMKRLTDNKL
ncbi:hypothetical protein KUCAC02_005234 [Chaenocephalus aceratus]|uniref:Uncharacterized protein n=1 Tax=Chaenocephalus aceratus TaxID=36190 RepID=A0ACB9WMW8_CHAAC|nr:hypothetical protein KUCAC02_005234 [Chaenocephalus aceratus]